MKIKDLTHISLVYILSSVFLGPIIYILGYSFTRGGGDYCDGVYHLPGGLVDPKRVTEFHNAQVFQVTGAVIMLTLGLSLLLCSFMGVHKNKPKTNAWVLVGITIMMLGYVLVILMSGKSGQNC